MRGTWQSSTVSTHYVTSGFLTLQLAVNRAILAVKAQQSFPALQQLAGDEGFGGPVLQSTSGASSAFASIPALSFSLSLYPTRAYLSDLFSSLLLSAGPLYLVIGFFPLLHHLTLTVVQELRRGVGAHLTRLGYRPSLLFVAYYLAYTALTAIPLAFMCLFGLYYSAEAFDRASLVFLLVFCYLQSLLLLAFVLGLWAKDERVAGQLSSVCILLLLLPSFLVSPESSPALLTLLALSSPVSFSLGFQVLTASGPSHELATRALQSFSLRSLSFALTMLAVDCTLYAPHHCSAAVPTTEGGTAVAVGGRGGTESPGGVESRRSGDGAHALHARAVVLFLVVSLPFPLTSPPLSCTLPRRRCPPTFNRRQRGSR